VKDETRSIVFLKKAYFTALYQQCLEEMKYINQEAGGPLMVAQWLRYFATNRNVAGSIPGGVIGILH
jgi:hypothetical protein